MRYVVYDIKTLDGRHEIGTNYLDPVAADQLSREANRINAAESNPERYEVVRRILWRDMFGEIINISLGLAFLYTWLIRHDLKQAGFIVLGRVLIFGIPVVIQPH